MPPVLAIGRKAIAPLVLIATLALGACTTDGGTGGTTLPSLPLATAVAPTDVPGSSVGAPPATAGAGLPTQSETDWGRIWDALPDAFPMPEAAQPAEAEAGPVSGAFTVPRTASDPASLARFYGDAFDAVGYGGGVDGPLEDGSFTTWASTGYGCDILVTVVPRGNESLVTALYGAGCPFD